MDVNQLISNIRTNKPDYQNLSSDVPQIIALEATRLSDKYNKDTFDCEDLQIVLGVGRSKARELLKKSSFPTLELDGLKKVSAIGLVLWMVKRYYVELHYL